MPAPLSSTGTRGLTTQEGSPLESLQTSAGVGGKDLFKKAVKADRNPLTTVESTIRALVSRLPLTAGTKLARGQIGGLLTHPVNSRGLLQKCCYCSIYLIEACSNPYACRENNPIQMDEMDFQSQKFHKFVCHV